MGGNGDQEQRLLSQEPVRRPVIKRNGSETEGHPSASPPIVMFYLMTCPCDKKLCPRKKDGADHEEPSPRRQEARAQDRRPRRLRLPARTLATSRQMYGNPARPHRRRCSRIILAAPTTKITSNVDRKMNSSIASNGMSTLTMLIRVSSCRSCGRRTSQGMHSRFLGPCSFRHAARVPNPLTRCCGRTPLLASGLLFSWEQLFWFACRKLWAGGDSLATIFS